MIHRNVSEAAVLFDETTRKRGWKEVVPQMPAVT
jgi:hypothetical protein